MKSHNWHELWRDWEKQDLVHRWQLGQLKIEHLVGHLLTWLSITIHWARATQEQSWRDEKEQAALKERVKAVEQALAALKKEQGRPK